MFPYQMFHHLCERNRQRSSLSTPLEEPDRPLVLQARPAWLRPACVQAADVEDPIRGVVTQMEHLACSDRLARSLSLYDRHDRQKLNSESLLPRVTNVDRERD
jgi:hypothetical protein